MLSLLATGIVTLLMSVVLFKASRVACRSSERLIDDYEDQCITARRRLENEIRRQRQLQQAQASTWDPVTAQLVAENPVVKILKKSKKAAPKPAPEKSVEAPKLISNPEEYFDVERTE